MLNDKKSKIGSESSQDSEIPSVFSMMSASNMADVLSGMTTGMDIFQIKMEDLVDAPEEWNFYSTLSESKMEELVESIRKNGLLHPIVVWEQQDGSFMVLSGHNRKRAYLKLLDETKEEKYKKIYCYVKKNNELTEDDAQNIIIDTNWVQRQLNPIEKAQSIYRKYTSMGRKQKVKNGEGTGIRTYNIIAEQYNVSGRQVLNYYKLNFLIEEFQKMIESNQLSISAGVKIADFDVVRQKWIYDNFKDELNNKNAIKLKRNMTEDEIKSILSLNKEDRVEIKYSIPLNLKNEFEEYIEKFFNDHDIF